ncbi:hypothetical protein BDF19DRAFT_436630 [Syncephalis fuscata]|nr:hypothetical protein BDF19DRAFT_436630 [Syncephalis fuscata]
MSDYKYESINNQLNSVSTLNMSNNEGPDLTSDEDDGPHPFKPKQSPALNSNTTNSDSSSSNTKEISVLPIGRGSAATVGMENTELRNRRYPTTDTTQQYENPMPMISTSHSNQWNSLEREITGYDSIYSEAAMAAAAADVIRNVHRTALENNQPTLLSAQHKKWKKHYNWLRQWLRDVFEPTVLRRATKGSMLFFIAMLLVLIKPVAHALGRSSYLIMISIILIQPARPIGAHLEATVLSVVALVLGIGYLAGALSISAAANAAQVRRGDDPSDGRWIAMAFLLFGVFWVTWIRVRFPRLSQPGHFAILTMAFGLTKGTAVTSFQPIVLFNIGIPIILGIALSLGVNLFIFPTTASDLRRTATTKAIKTIKVQLIQTTSEFLAPSLETIINTPNPSRRQSTSNIGLAYNVSVLHSTKTRSERIDDLIKTKHQLSLSIPSLVDLTKHAVYEVNIARHNPRDYKRLSGVLAGIQQHLASMVLALRREEEWMQKEMEIARMAQTESVQPMRSPSLEESTYDSSILSKDLGRRLGRVTIRQRLQGRGDIILLAHMVDLTRDAALKLMEACTSILDSMHDTVEQDVFPQSDLRAIWILLTSWMPFRWAQAAIPAIELEEGHNRQEQLNQLLDDALTFYDIAEKDCIREMYSHSKLIGQREEHFLAFGFIYSLREIAMKMRELLELEPRFSVTPNCRQWQIWWPSVGIRKWLRRREDSAEDVINGGNYMEYAERLCETTERAVDDEQTRKQNARWARKRNKRLSSQQTMHQPRGSRVRLTIWHMIHWFQGYRVKFAFKMMLCTFAISLTGYINADTDAFFQNVHGQWALTTALFVLSIDMGSTFLLGLFRLLGTIFGTVWAIFILSVTERESPYIIGGLMMLHGVIAWRMMYSPKTLRFAIASLLTISSTVLGFYTGSYAGQDVILICLYRGAGVSIALLVSITIHQLFWPFFARNELRKLLSLLIHELGQTYAMISSLRLVDRTDAEYPTVYTNVEKRIHLLQSGLVRANELLTAATSEPRLKGPFPADVYLKLIRAMRDSAAWLVSMRSAALQSHPANVRRILSPNISAHRDLTAAVLLYYHVVSGSLRSKLPLPAYLPSARAARRQALHSTWPVFESFSPREDELRKGKDIAASPKSIKSDDNTPESSSSSPLYEISDSAGMRMAYWFAYSAGLSELIREQERLASYVQKLIGVDELMAFHLE